MSAFIYIGVGALAGAWLRWGFGALLNPIFPTVPLGTLAANLLGAFIMGIVMEVTKDNLFITKETRLGITTGFLGSLTTFSTFSAETVTLLSHQEYTWSMGIICIHVLGSILATFAGIFSVKLVTS